MKMADDSDICFVCGTPGADMRDHVLFDCLFVPPRPSNLLTLPAHYRCQNKLHEEYFRNIAAGLSLDTSHTAHTLWEDKVYRSLQRNSPLRDSLRASLLRKVNLVSSGGIWLGTTPESESTGTDSIRPLKRLYVAFIGTIWGGIYPLISYLTGQLTNRYKVNDSRFSN
jgi:hypothetical protein